MRARKQTAVTTPNLMPRTWDDIVWLLVALLGNGYSHTWHADDSNYVPTGHHYKVVEYNIPTPSEAYNDRRNFRLWKNNCTTRIETGRGSAHGTGVFHHPAAYSSYHGFFDQTFWFPNRRE
jgi:hypothetical protein